MRYLKNRCHAALHKRCSVFNRTVDTVILSAEARSEVFEHAFGQVTEILEALQSNIKR